MSTPNPPADGSGHDDDAGQQPAPEQSSWDQPAQPSAPPAYGQQPPADPYGQPQAPPPPPPPPYGQQPPVSSYGQQPPSDPYGQQPPPPPYGQQTPPPPPYGQQPPAAPYAQQPWAPEVGYPVAPVAGYGTGVLPKEAYASWGQRVGASLLDALLTLPFSIIGLILYFVGLASLTRTVSYDANGYPTTSLSGVSVLAVVGVLLASVGTIAVSIWNRWYKAGKTGQSWGKQVMGLRLVREVDGQPVGIGMAFLRDIVHIVDGICYIGYLFPLWDAKRQTLSDKIMSTIVLPNQTKSSKLF